MSVSEPMGSGPPLDHVVDLLRCVLREDEVAGLFWCVAGIAGLHRCFRGRFAIGGEVPEAPPAGSGVLLGVLDMN